MRPAPRSRFLARVGARLASSAFARGSMWTIAGNGAGHLVVVATAPWLSRLYTPADYGAYGAFLAVLMMVVSVAGLRYEIAVPVPTSEAVAARLAVVALGAVLVTAVLAGVVAAALGWSPGGLPPGATGAWLALGIVGVGGYQVLASWSARARAYRVLSLSRIARSTTQVGLQVLAGYAGWGGFGLVVGHVAGSAAGVVRMARSLGAAVRSVPITWATLASAAATYWRFPAFSAPSGLLNSAGNQAPLLVILAAFGPEVAGGFAFAQRVVAAPVTVVGYAVGQVFVGEFGALVRTRSPAALRLYGRTLVRLFALGSVPIAGLALVAPAAFGWVFGPAWVEAGHFVRVLAPMLLVQFAVVPVSSVLNLLERTRAQLAYDAIRFALGVGSMALWIGGGAAPLTTVAVYAAGMTVAYVLNALFGYLILRGELTHGARPDR